MDAPKQIVADAIADLAAFRVANEHDAARLLSMWARFPEMTADDRNAVYRHYRKGGA